MLLRALDEQKATAVGGASGGAAAKKRSLEEALGEVRECFLAQLYSRGPVDRSIAR
jgi:hypothetical protein